jgi:hypothetical protein
MNKYFLRPDSRKCKEEFFFAAEGNHNKFSIPQIQYLPKLQLWWGFFGEQT